MIDVKKATELLEILAKAMKNNKKEETIKALGENMNFYLSAVNDAINPILTPTVPFLCASLRYVAQTLEADHHAEALTAELMVMLKKSAMSVVIPVGKGTVSMEGGEEE